MTPILARLYAEAKSFHARVTAATGEIESAIKTGSDPGEESDAAYALREIIKLTEDVEKQCSAQRRLAERMACLLTVAVGSGDTIRTSYCSATPQVKTIVTVPRKSTDPEGYAELMRYLRVPEELWNVEGYAAVQTHWPGMVELLAEKQQRGESLPPGIDPNKTYAEYSLVIRGKLKPDQNPVAEVLATPPGSHQGQENSPF